MDGKAACVHLDGSDGEGGGQILRSALTLSMITGRPFCITNIRARRRKPGLLRQHLTAVNAAAEICSAETSGAYPGSTRLDFRPGTIRGGKYHYAIGTAGSCTLVLQTILPALWHADAPSTVTVTGGTHNGAAPPADFLIAAWLPLIRRMGVDMDIELLRHGFYPAGGGAVSAMVRPATRLLPLHLVERGERLRTEAQVVVAGLPENIAVRELNALLDSGMAFDNAGIRTLPTEQGPGNVVLLTLAHRHVSEVIAGFGEKGVPVKAVVERTMKTAHRYLDSGAAAGEYLADQLILPMALAGGGDISAAAFSSHLQTNIAVIGKFLPVTFTSTLKEKSWRITVDSVKGKSTENEAANIRAS